MTMNSVPHEDWHSRHRSPHNRPTIAYLAPSISGGSLAQWSGVVDSAMTHGVNLLSVPGGSLHDPRAFVAQANIAYQLINPTSVQGVIAWASTIGNYVGEDTIKAFCENYRGLPFVSIGRAQPGIPSLLMDSYQGMCEAIRHLIEGHGYRRIAFVRGPENHTYARERLRAYIETLEAYGIPYDPQLVTPASRDWERTTGGEMMRVLLDDRGLKPQTHIEALVSANDDLILGAWQVLRERKIQVPDDIALVGFDHVMDGQTSTPPLTSVAAPFYDVGRQAVNVLLALLAGEEVPDLITVPSILMVHQSCGCQSPAVRQAGYQPPVVIAASGLERKSPAQLLAARRADLLAGMDRAVSELGGKLAPESAAQWVDGLVIDFEGGTSGGFLAALQDTLYQTMIDDEDIAALHGAIPVLVQDIVPSLNDSTLLLANSLFQQAQIMISEAARRRQAHQQALAEQRAQSLAEVGATLIAAFDLDELMNTLSESLPRLNIPSAYLILYQEPERYRYPAPPAEWSQLVLAFDEYSRMAAGVDNEPFRTQELLPADVQVPGRSRSLALMPLYFRDQQLGIGLFEAGAHDGPTVERLRGQISSALQGALLMQQVQQHAAQLATIITETLATSEEMRVTITETSRQARAVANAAQQSIDVSRTGQDAVSSTMTGMDTIQRQVADIARSILALSERTQQIGQIISAVEDIADQSRLLALNASIEAARAGDEGRGFAVVAREMRHLAGQSREATTQVSRILNDIQQAANMAVMVTEEGSKGAQQGIELASQAGVSIRDLSAVIEDAARVAAQIAASTEQQSNAMDQLVSAIRSIKLASSQSIAGFKDNRP